jgi:hypothetical protein
MLPALPTELGLHLLAASVNKLLELALAVETHLMALQLDGRLSPVELAHPASLSLRSFTNESVDFSK